MPVLSKSPVVWELPAFPSGIPPSTQALIVAMSASDNRRLSAKSPNPGSGSHGGMKPAGGYRSNQLSPAFCVSIRMQV